MNKKNNKQHTLTARQTLSLSLGFVLFFGVAIFFLPLNFALLRFVAHYGLIFAIITICGIIGFIAIDRVNITSFSALAVTGIIAIIGSIVYTPYHNSHWVYENSHVSKNQPISAFDNRSPYQVAQGVMERSLGSIVGDATGPIKSLGENNRQGSTYSQLVKKRELFGGYKAIQTLTVPTFGSVSIKQNQKFCTIPEDNNKILSSMLPWRSLRWEFYRDISLNPFVYYDNDDVIPLCIDNKPYLIVPVVKDKLLATGTATIFDKVVLYDFDKDKFIPISKENKDKLPTIPSSTPTYSITVAKEQFKSLRTQNGLYPWIMQRVGFDTTDKDDEDPNMENPSQIVLNLEKDNNVTNFVTPALPRGSSKSITDLVVIGAKAPKNGSGLNPIVIEKYDSPMQNTTSIATTIIGNAFDGYKASNLEVFEIVPSSPAGTWTASIGRKQSILYRASIDINNNVTLYDAHSGDKGITIEADKLKNQNSKPLKTSQGTKDLEHMSNDELKQLAQQVLDEMAKRAQTAN